ncbi:MAG: hypothetical protein KJO07_11315, partial [Deltaproteobacteria bacterium]|nr:hypothetical protein [Deltaproteobacteria bacterium]
LGSSDRAGLDPRTRVLRSEEEVAERTEENRVAHSTPTAPDDWEERKLCPDGGCIGVIAEDGKCTECGQPA